APPTSTSCDAVAAISPSLPPALAGSGLLLRLRRHAVPRLVRVVARQLRDRGGRLGPEVLLVRDAVLVDHERHDPGGRVVQGPGHEAEAARHRAILDVVGGAARRGRALALEDAVVVAVQRRGPLAGSEVVALLAGLRDQHAERA